MTRTLAGALALVALLLSGTAVQAAEEVVPFHTTLTLVEDCETSPSASEQCLGFPDWLASCQAQGYDWGFQDVRNGEATPCHRRRQPGIPRRGDFHARQR